MEDIRKHLPPEDVIALDMSSPEVPSNVKLLRPVVYKDGDAYCCLLGEDPQVGVFGCGDTLKEALEDWDNHYKEIIEHGKGSQQK